MSTPAVSRPALTSSARRWLTGPRQATVAGLFGGGNAIGLLRFALASLVVVHHTRILGGFGADPLPRLTRSQVDLGIIAVAGFFTLSGMLITRSALHASTARYLWHRCLRILPGYWACLIVIATVVGPAIWWSTHGGLDGYLSQKPSPAGYVVHNAGLLVTQFKIGSLTATNPYPYGINGSLWTLAYEFAWYMVVAVLAATRLLRRPWVVAGVLLLALLGTQVHWHPLGAVPVIGYAFESRFGISFACGMLAYLLRDRLPLDDRLALVAGVVLVGTARYGGFASLGMVALAYVVLWAARRLPMRGFGTRHDLSYGLYIYAFPIQQSLAHFVPGLSYLAFMAASFALTVPAAWLSYTLIEAPALRFKDARPPTRARLSALLRLGRTDSGPTEGVVAAEPVPILALAGAGAGGGIEPLATLEPVSPEPGATVDAPDGDQPGH